MLPGRSKRYTANQGCQAIRIFCFEVAPIPFPLFPLRPVGHQTPHEGALCGKVQHIQVPWSTGTVRTSKTCTLTDNRAQIDSLHTEKCFYQRTRRTENALQDCKVTSREHRLTLQNAPVRPLAKPLAMAIPAMLGGSLWCDLAAFMGSVCQGTKEWCSCK